MSSYNAAFPVEGRVMIDKTFSERKREISLNLYSFLFVTRHDKVHVFVLLVNIGDEKYASLSVIAA